MSECTCGKNFIDAEDYRDHLPCPGTPDQQRIKELENQLALKTLELEAQVGALVEAVDENLQRAVRAEKALAEATCTRWGIWASPSKLNSSSAEACWHKEQVVIAYATPDEARAAHAAMPVNEYWTAEPRPLPLEVRAVPAHLVVGIR